MSKKIVNGALAIVLLAFVLTACSSDDTNQTGNTGNGAIIGGNSGGNGGGGNSNGNIGGNA